MSVSHETESELLHKGPCDLCGSSDGRAVYSDGHSYCFAGCEDDERYQPGDGDRAGGMQVARPNAPKELLPIGEYRDLNKRGLTAETCKRYGYSVGKDRDGEPVQIATYCDGTGAPVAQKLRTPDKDFAVLGDLKKAGLFGQHLWPSKGKKIIITEGEIDCLSVAQAQSLKWPVVSVPNGAGGAAKSLTANLDFLRGYEEIVLWFDADEAGREAIEKCVLVLPPGKVKIITTPDGLKDANDLLRAQGPSAVVSAIWNAQTYRPDGVITGAAITKERLKSPSPMGWQTPYPILNDMTRGIKPKQVWLLTAGSGVGKSTDAREWMLKALSDGKRVGAVFLEEDVDDTALSLVALDNNVPVVDLEENKELLTDAQWDASISKLFNEEQYQAYDHFGSVDSDNLMAKLEFMAANGAEILFVDHISIAVSGLDMEEGERRAIDKLMTNLKTMAVRTGCSIVAISHLRKVSSGNKSFEEGGQIGLDDLRGSGALKQLSDIVIAKERNQQGDHPDFSKLRVLKCRKGGKTGLADTLKYDPQTGRLQPYVAPDPMEVDESESDDAPF